MEAGLNSDPGNDSFSDKIRDAKHVDRSTHYSTLAKKIETGTHVNYRRVHA